MSKNQLYAMLGLLVIAVVGLGIYAYQESTKPSGVELRIDETGVSIEQN